MKINIGAGDTRYDGFLNCDYDKRSSPDFQFNLETDRYPFEDNSVEAVIAHHVLEHLGDGYFHCLKELYRICKPGALIDVRVPHPRHTDFIDDPTHRRPITPQGLSLFSKKYNDICIRQNTMASRLGYYFNVDFELVDVVEVPDPKYLKTFNSMTVDAAQRYIHEHNNIVLEYRIKLVVVKE